MFIHTDKASEFNIYTIMEDSGLSARNLYVDIDRYGSRSHADKIEVRLYAYNSRPHYNATRRTQSGEYYAATWGEWGVFIANIFAADPNAIVGQYKGVKDFHSQTHGIFAGDIGEDEANLTTRQARKLIETILTS